MSGENNKNYNAFWKRCRIKDPSMWASWSVIKDYSKNTPCLEIGCGNMPRIPIKGSFFVDSNEESIKKLNELGGKGVLAQAETLPFSDSKFGVVCAFNLLEHVENDKLLVKEIRRVLKKDGKFMFSVPVNMEHWTDFDKKVGHFRRYKPEELNMLLEEEGFKIEKFNSNKKRSIFGKNKRLMGLASFFLGRFPGLSFLVASELFMPVMEKFSKFDLKESNFVQEAQEASNVIVVCSASESKII
ncbi:MAG: class I SAM-dependent methyltransferase [bacterium]|nr:class I SAM-dependent methyltransferase [bacterium]